MQYRPMWFCPEGTADMADDQTVKQTGAVNLTGVSLGFGILLEEARELISDLAHVTPACSATLLGSRPGNLCFSWHRWSCIPELSKWAPVCGN